MKPYQEQYADVITASKEIVNSYTELTAKTALAIFIIKRQMNEKGFYNFYASESLDNGTYQTVIYSADAHKASKILSEVSSYMSKCKPFEIASKNCFTIKSVSGKGKKVTAKLSKAVTKAQMLGALSRYWYLVSSEDAANKTLSFPIYVLDTKKNTYISATATITTGSNDISIICSKKLTSGTKYELTPYNYKISSAEDKAYDWIHQGKSTFTAK